MKNKVNIGLLLGDPSGIGPELISKLLKRNELDEANIIIIGEKKILEDGDKVANNENTISYVKILKKLTLKRITNFF